ncbi:MAG: hypothetical protein ACXW05_08335 [Gemmatirosa sp.]
MLRDLPTHRPWLDPIAMRWRQFRREDTHCERFERVQGLLAATRDLRDRSDQQPGGVRAILGAHPA